MRKTAVRDAWGARWSVRARQLRGGGTEHPRPGPEEESLRRRLATALSPQPAGAGAVGAADWWHPTDTADVEKAAVFAQYRDTPMREGTAPWAVGHFVRLVGDAIDHLRTPLSETWEVELIAGGRIRRWARWQIAGAEAAAQAMHTVASAVRAGTVPDPWGATLVDVVDQRPLPRQVR